MSIVYAGFYLFNNDIFNSPDETAQSYFINRLASGEVLAPSIDTAYDGYEYVAPRSMRVVNGTLVPGSFLGLIGLYGTAGRLMGVEALFFLMGVVAVAGLIAFYKIVEYVFNREIAQVSFLLALFSPAWWYYASLGLFPNVLLVTLALWSIATYILFKQTRKHLYAVLCGICIALALLVRLAAAPWVLGIWAILLLLDARRKEKRMLHFYIVVSAMVVIFCIMPLLVIQTFLYGTAGATGYVISSAGEKSNSIAQYFPWGIHPRQALTVVWDYYVMLFWYSTIPAILGTVFFIARCKVYSLLQRKYAFLVILLAAWLSLYYGSGVIDDNINQEVTIGVSYVRYFLPLYILLIPFSVLGVSHILKNIKQLQLRRAAATVLILFSIMLGGYDVYVRYDDSLISVAATLMENRQVRNEVVALTPNDAIILSMRHDKIFFPERSVAHVNSYEELKKLIDVLHGPRPLYVYTIDDESVVEISIDVEMVRGGQEITKGYLYAISN